MPGKKPSPPSSLPAILEEMRAHNVILEAVRSQNRLTIEAVETAKQVLEQKLDGLEHRLDRLEPRLDRLVPRFDRLEARFDGLERDTRSRDTALELAVRDLKLSVQQNGHDIRELARKAEVLSILEDRVTTLEKRAEA
jgi:predicted nuclease with TOPRIM domain